MKYEIEFIETRKIVTVVEGENLNDAYNTIQKYYENSELDEMLENGIIEITYSVKKCNV